MNELDRTTRQRADREARSHVLRGVRALGRVLHEALEAGRVVALALAHLALGEVDGLLRRALAALGAREGRGAYGADGAGVGGHGRYAEETKTASGTWFGAL